MHKTSFSNKVQQKVAKIIHWINFAINDEKRQLFWKKLFPHFAIFVVFFYPANVKNVIAPEK